MQVAHPLVAAGVDQHSDFRRSPLRRLVRTVDTTLAIVYGERAPPGGARRPSSVRVAPGGSLLADRCAVGRAPADPAPRIVRASVRSTAAALLSRGDRGASRAPDSAAEVDHRGAPGAPVRERDEAPRRERLRVWRAAAFTLVALVVTACGQPAAPTASPASNVPCGPSEVFTRHDHCYPNATI